MQRLLNEQEVAEQIGMSVHWLRRMRWAGGGIPYLKIGSGRGGSVRYRHEDVAAFLEAKRRRSTSDPGDRAAN